MDAKIDCNLLTPFPPTKTVSSSHLFEIDPLPFKTYLTALQSGKTIALKERLPCP